MHALVKTNIGPENTLLQDVARPQPDADEALIRVRAAAVCASDIHLWRDAFPCAVPVILGHEFTGTVESIGKDVANVAPGDAVVSVNNPDACGVCPACRDGHPNLCPEKRALGFKRDGCFADYVRVPSSLLHRVPAGVPALAATLAEPLAVAVHAVADRGGVHAGQFVVVLGPGAIGLLAAQVARAEGADRVLVAGTDADMAQRLPKARELGFATCNVQTDDLRGRVLELTGGHGADVVIEASGAPPAVASAVDLVRRGGRIVASGLTGCVEIPVAWDTLVAKAVTVVFTFSSRPRNWETGLRYLAEGRVQTLPLISDLDELANWEAAFERMAHGACIRSVFVFDPELRGEAGAMDGDATHTTPREG